MSISLFIRLSVLASLLLTPEIATAGQKKPAPATTKKKPAVRKRSTSPLKKTTKKTTLPPPAPVLEEKKVESDLVPAADLRGPTRLDFDDRLIQGQTNKSGAVYLFDRKETGISSMVRRRKSFRQLTIHTVYDR